MSFFVQESPPLSRNAPIVSGAVAWSRGLLRKIEEPMKIFRENKFVTALRVSICDDFSQCNVIFIIGVVFITSEICC